jgi:hypothetical protein
MRIIVDCLLGVVLMFLVVLGFLCAGINIGANHQRNAIIATTCIDGGKVEDGRLYCYDPDGLAEGVIW